MMQKNAKYPTPTITEKSIYFYQLKELKEIIIMRYNLKKMNYHTDKKIKRTKIITILGIFYTFIKVNP
jgi:hypothetical protein